MQFIMKEFGAADAPKTIKRRRGRPTKQEAIGLPLEALIVDAAKRVCCEAGVHGLTVELILQKSGISRPTFYKFFKNKEMVLEVISTQVHQKLVDAMRNAVNEPDVLHSAPEAIVDRVVDSYLAWGKSQGRIVSRLYETITDDAFIVTQHRNKALEALMHIFQEATIKAGLPKRDPLLLTSLISLVEFLGNPLFSKKQPKAEYERVRNVMRMVLQKLLLGNDVVPYDS